MFSQNCLRVTGYPKIPILGIRAQFHRAAKQRKMLTIKICLANFFSYQPNFHTNVCILAGSLFLQNCLQVPRYPMISNFRYPVPKIIESAQPYIQSNLWF